MEKEVLQEKKSLVPKLRFKIFNEKWNSYELQTMTPLNEKYGIVDGPFGSNLKTIHYKNEGIPIITSGYVTNGFFHASEYLYVTEEKFQKEKRSAVKAGDIVMAKIGARCGASAILPIGHQTGILSGNALKITIDETRFSSHIVWQVLLNLYNTHMIDPLRTVGAQPAISIANLKKFKVILPTLPEQQKIASILSAVDEKIQQLTQKKELLEQYKKGVMQQLFSGKLRFKDENGKAFPKWEEKRLGDVSVFLDGRRKPIKSQDRAQMKGEYPYYGASGIIDYVNEYLFDEEIILLGEDGENIVSRNLPLAFRVSGKCWVNNHAHVIKPNQGTDIDFLTYSLERVNYVIYNTGTAQPKLNQEVCRNIPLSMPSFEEQKKIANYLSNIDSKIESVNKQITQMQAFKKGLLQQMFV